MCDSGATSFLFPPSQCKTSEARCFLLEEAATQLRLFNFTMFWQQTTKMCCCFFLPIRSAKPPTGRRQVPVTNCSSLILFSLSISFTSCRGGNLVNPHRGRANFFLPKGFDTDLPEPEDLFAVPSVVPVDGVSLPVCKVDVLHATQHHLWRETGKLKVTHQTAFRRTDRS